MTEVATADRLMPIPGSPIHFCE